MNIKVKSWLLIITTFTLGLVIGVLSTTYSIKKSNPHHWEKGFRPGEYGRPPHPFIGGPRGKRMISHLMDKLELTEEQRKEIEPIINTYTKQIHSMMRNTKLEVHKTMKKLHAEIYPFLNEEQKIQLDTFKEKMDRHKIKREF